MRNDREYIEFENLKALKEVRKDEVVGLYDIGEECVIASIKITNEEKFRKNIKQFIRIVERRFYDFGWDWTEAFNDLLKKCKDLGFRKARNTVNFGRVFRMQEIAPHFEYKAYKN